MRPMVFSMSIDGPNMALLDRWLADGSLPVLAALMAGGAAGRHHHIKRFRNERCWDLWLAARDIGATGSTFRPGDYAYFNTSLQREQGYEPFYALGPDYRVCAFDLPATIHPGVHGLQLAGWGSELNVALPVSSPPGLIDEIQARHGHDPKLTRALKVIDHQTSEIETSYIIPNLYDRAELDAFCEKLLLSVERRTDICLDLLARGPWDLFLVNFPESHTANHLLWHMSEPHPMGDLLRANATPHALPGDAMRSVFKAIDTALGRIRQALPSGATIVVSTLDHTAANTMDLPGMAMLPELLHRWSRAGEALLAPGHAGTPVPPRRRDYADLWKHEVWRLVTPAGRQRLLSPATLEAQGDPMSWHPAVWYRNLWPSLEAFALPSVADGYVRLNIAGRERDGRVAPADYDARLAEISAMLEALRDPRTGMPAVKRLERTRTHPFEAPDIPPDLIVSWNGDTPADCLDSPTLGRVGPLPYFRSGGHVAHGSHVDGLFVAHGPGIAPASCLPRGRLEDVPATILGLLGLRPSPPMTGVPLLARPHKAMPAPDPA